MVPLSPLRGSLDLDKILDIRPIESHSGALGNILAGPPNIFMGPLWGENF